MLDVGCDEHCSPLVRLKPSVGIGGGGGGAGGGTHEGFVAVELSYSSTDLVIESDST